MMKWILAILLLISATTFGQIGRGDDSTKYIRYQNQYGQRMPRSWWDSVVHMPYGDTAVFPKPCRPGAIMMHTDKVFYKWNGAGWDAMGSSGSASRFGIEDATSAVNRRIGMNYHNMVIDSAGLITLHSHIPGQNSYLTMNGSTSIQTIDSATGQSHSIGIYPDQIQVSTPYAGVPAKMVFNYSDSLRPSNSNFRVAVFDNDTLKVISRDSLGGGGSGEVNTASNVGSGTGIFKTKSGVDLQFKSITSDATVTVTNNTNDVNLKADTGYLKGVYLPLYLPSAKTINQATNNITFAGGGKVRGDSLSLKKTIKPFINADSANIFGHSIAAGSGASVSDSAYFVIVARSHGLFASNKGVPGDIMRGAVKIQMQWIQPGHNSYTMYMAALNDVRVTNILSAGNRKTLNYLINGLKCMWMNHMAKSVLAASDGSLTRSGSWTTNWDATAEAGKVTTGAYTSSSGSYIEYSFTDSTVGFQLMGLNTAGASTVTVAIDGSTVETFTTNGQYDDNTSVFEPMCKFYTGLANTSHTLRVTNTSGGFLIMDYFTHLRDAATAPPICFFHEPHLNTAGIGGGSGTVAAIDTLNAKYDSLRNALPAAWKARTIVARTNSRYDPTTADVSGDNVHPSDQGHRKIARTEADAIATVIPADSGTVQYGEDGFLYADAKKIPYANSIGLSDVLNNNPVLSAPGYVSGNTLEFNGFTKLGFNFFKINSSGALAHGTLGVQGPLGGVYIGDRNGDTTKSFMLYNGSALLRVYDGYNGRDLIKIDTGYKMGLFNNPLNNVFANPTATLHIGGNDAGIAGHAPLKINKSLWVSSPEPYAWEVDSLYIGWTNGGSVRDTIATRGWARANLGGTTLTSGTYTPTLTNESNVTSSTAYQCQYMRVGNVVTVSGKITIDYTSTGLASVGISLPIASSISNDYEIAGTANAEVNNGARIQGDPTNDRAQFYINTGSSAGYDYFFTFTYLVQ